jgi:hypothetical protein
MPVVSAEPVVTAACFFCCRRAMGAASIRHSPCPLFGRACPEAELGRKTRREKAASRVPRERRGTLPGNIRKKPYDFRFQRRFMVRSEGLEPPRFYSLPPQGSASTNSATSAGMPAQGSGRINGADVTNRPWGDKARRRPKSGVYGGIFVDLGMIRKSGDRFSEKIMLKQEAKARWHSSRFSARPAIWAASA